MQLCRSKKEILVENAYERGFEDARAGCTDENPYHEEYQPDEYANWEAGYNDYLEAHFIEDEDTEE